MPAATDDAADAVDGAVRRSVVPRPAGRSVWLAAVWTGVAPVLAGAVLGIVAVAVCWLPASGTDGNAGSVFRAGVLTFLAGLHGGITVDGVPAAFVPLGLTVAIGVLAWRAGLGLADACADLGEERAPRLLAAGAVQVFAFALACGVAARLSRLGTSHVDVVGAVLAAAVLFLATGSVAFARAAGLLEGRVPERLAAVLRAAGAAALAYLGAGALLVAGSLLMHRDRVELLSAHVGGGWSGAPVLVLGVLAAPNAALAGASYLAGPGFALGTGSVVTLGGSTHGILPAFPVLGAVPSGPAGSAAWLLAAAAPVAAGLAVVRVLRNGAALREVWLRLGGSVVGTALLGGAAAGLAGGGIGSGRLAAVGASPWQFGLAAAAATAAVAVPSLAALDALAWWRRRQEDALPVAVLRAVPGRRDRGDEPEGADQLAG